MRYLFILFSLLLPIISFAATSNNIKTMNFVNQRGSKLTLIFNQTAKNAGTLSGTFATAVAAKDCKQVIGQPHKVTGVYNGNAVSFSVNYPSCGTVVSIIGNFDQQKNIESLWITSQQGVSSLGKDWNTRNIGDDKYRLVRKAG